MSNRRKPKRPVPPLPSPLTAEERQMLAGYGPVEPGLPDPRNILCTDEQAVALIEARYGVRYSLEEIRDARECLVAHGFLGARLDADGNVRYDLLGTLDRA